MGPTSRANHSIVAVRHCARLIGQELPLTSNREENVGWPLFSRDKVNSFLHFCAFLADNVSILLYTVKVQDAIDSKHDTTSGCCVSSSHSQSYKKEVMIVNTISVPSSWRTAHKADRLPSSADSRQRAPRQPVRGCRGAHHFGTRTIVASEVPCWSPLD